MSYKGTSRDVEAYERQIIHIYGNVAIGASGAVGTIKGGGIVTVVKEATAGQYSVTLVQPINQILSARASIMDDAVSAIAAVQVLEDPAAVQAGIKSDGKILLQCLDFAGAAANPASGASLRLEFVVRRTSSGPFD